MDDVQIRGKENQNAETHVDITVPQVIVQIVSIEWTLENPVAGLDVQWSRFTASPVRRVPLLHVYGCDPVSGQKMCAHLHNVLPYFFVSLPDAVPLDAGTVYRYMHQLQLGIDRAMSLTQRASGKSVSDATVDTTTTSSHLSPQRQSAAPPPHSPVSNEPHVFAIVLVRGKPFYGFSVSERLFLKIFVYNPYEVSQIASLLRSGVVLGTQFQVYEAHIPFTLQVMADYDLFGMNVMRLRRVRFRRPLPRRPRTVQWCGQEVDMSARNVGTPSTPYHYWTERDLTSENVSPCAKSTFVEVEFDADVEDIILSGHSTSSSSSPENDSVGETKLIHSLTEIWEDERRRNSTLSSAEYHIATPVDRRQSIGDFVLSASGNSSGAHVLSATPLLSLRTAITCRLRERLHALITAEHEYLQQRGEVNMFAATEHVSGAQSTPSDTNPQHHPLFGLSQATQNPLLLSTPQAHSIRAPVAEQTVLVVTHNAATSDSKSVIPVPNADEELCDILNWMRDQHTASKKGDGHDMVAAHTENALDNDEVNYNSDGEAKDCDVIADAREPPVATSEQDDIIESQRLICENNGEGDNPTIAKELKIEGDRSAVEDEAAGTGELLRSRRVRCVMRCDDAHSPLLATKRRRVAFDTTAPVIRYPSTSLGGSLLSSAAEHHKADNGAVVLESPLSLSPTRPFGVSSQPMSTGLHLERSTATTALADTHLRAVDATRWPRVYTFYKAAPSSHELVQKSCSRGVPALQYPRPHADWTPSVHQLPLFPRRSSFVCVSQHVPTPTIASSYVFTPARLPPDPQLLRQRYSHVSRVAHLTSTDSSPPAMEFISQIECVAPVESALEFDASQEPYYKSSTLWTPRHLTLLSAEIHVNTRGDLRADPLIDAVQCVCYAVHDDTVMHVLCSDTACREATATSPYRYHVGVLLLSDPCHCDPFLVSNASLMSCEVHCCATELQLFQKLIEVVRYFDPEILVGYETQTQSWGYLIERARALQLDLCAELSRAVHPMGGTSSHYRSCPVGLDQVIKPVHSPPFSRYIVGRMVFNVWRILKSEVTTMSYTFENMCWLILHRRVPHFAPRTLTEWYTLSLATSPAASTRRWKVVHLYLTRADATLRMLHALNIIGRTSELARLFGLDLWSVLSRGSQYRVESMVLRATKPRNYLLFSPSRHDVMCQNAPECVPLVMEPHSNYYTDPVLVLDFQSLYPSVIIAYNYCYSTCLGKLQLGEGPHNVKRFGTTILSLPRGLLGYLEPYIFVSPNGVMFVTPSILQGILPRLLREILETRVMVKAAMKRHKSDAALCRMLDARQLGLKLLANVTYGYTGANFSGRMPCIDIADSIVQTARETLESAIRIVESRNEWGARVIYGDTDSLFVCLPGASKERAFEVGQQIADAVTKSNPSPITLRLEKVYKPCILAAKKRYVGYKWESIDQSAPIFEAKGIELVRRDSCPAVAKILEKSLRTLFDTQDVSQVKRYVQRQMIKLIRGRVSVADFVFQKEVRLGTYRARNEQLPPAALVSLKALALDPRAEPCYGERIPYVVTAGPTANTPLRDLVHHPHVFLQHPHWRLHHVYYITKQILPALDRLFSLVGVDVKTWYNELPKSLRSNRPPPVAMHRHVSSRSSYTSPTVKITIDQYYQSQHCPVCDQLTTPKEYLCHECLQQPQIAAFILLSRRRWLQKQQQQLIETCMHCIAQQDPQIECDSLDCNIFYERVKIRNYLETAEMYNRILQNATKKRTEKAISSRTIK